MTNETSSTAAKPARSWRQGALLGGLFGGLGALAAWWIVGNLIR